MSEGRGVKSLISALSKEEKTKKKQQKKSVKYLIFFSVSYIIIMLHNLQGFMPSFGKIGFTFPVRNFLRRKILCRCVGIGRRGGLKILCQRWRVGSNPTTGTRNRPNISDGFFVQPKSKIIVQMRFSSFCSGFGSCRTEPA